MKAGRFTTIVDRARRSYGHKLQVLCNALEEHAGQYLATTAPRALRPRGGFFLWLALKHGGSNGDQEVRADRLHLELLSRGVMCGLGEHYYGPGMHDAGWQEEEQGSGTSRGGGGSHLRLAFIGCSDEELLEAACRIGAACAAVRAAEEAETDDGQNAAAGSPERVLVTAGATSSRL